MTPLLTTLISIALLFLISKIKTENKIVNKCLVALYYLLMVTGVFVFGCQVYFNFIK